MTQEKELSFGSGVFREQSGALVIQPTETDLQCPVFRRVLEFVLSGLVSAAKHRLETQTPKMIAASKVLRSVDQSMRIPVRFRFDLSSIGGPDSGLISADIPAGVLAEMCEKGT